MSNQLRIIGLVGGIASGKSSAAAAFRKLGAIVLDADALVHETLSLPEIQAKMREEFGAAIFDNGSLNRKKLADLIFRDGDKRKFLETLIHPRVRQRMEKEIAEIRQSGAGGLLVLDVPLLMEAGLSERCEKMIFVDAPLETRVARAAKYRGWTREEMLDREKAQMDPEWKKNQADGIIRNHGSKEELELQVRNLFQTLLKH